LISEAEIDFGLVLHLDPEELEAQGGTYTCPKEFRVQGRHFFICIGADEESALWLPLYSSPGIGRDMLTSEGRSGHSKWTKATCHYHRGQVWTASHAAVVSAARAGGDMSEPGRRNLLSDEFVPILE
jgi:hypothetical protein